MPNLLEGGRRIGVAGLVALRISAGTATLALLLIEATFTLPRYLAYGLPIMLQPTGLLVFGLTFWLAVAGAALCATGWIVRGFGKPQDLSFSPPPHECQEAKHPLS